MDPAPVVRLLFIIYGLMSIIIGLLYRQSKEDAAYADPTSYWFWFSGNEPYVKDPDQRVAHVGFKSKLLLTSGVPILIAGIFTPDPVLSLIGIIGIGLVIFLPVFLYYLFVADADDRNTMSEEEEPEKIREMEEFGKLD